MSGIPPAVGLGVTRLVSQFHDEIGNKKRFHGTGFWIAFGGREVFVTNAHNVDLRLRSHDCPGFKLTGLELELRRAVEGIHTAETRFFQVLNLAASLRVASDADCAIVVRPQFLDYNRSYQLQLVAADDGIADDDWLAQRIQVMDQASFIGFPRDSHGVWWDEAWSAPIARSCTIASEPRRSFVNAQIRTTDVTLVGGLSFVGSSGSPVIAHQKGFKVGGLLTGGPEYVPAKLIGIMSGHFDTEGEGRAPQIYATRDVRS